MLSRVVIPEYVVVHDGVPSDSTATDYYVRYADYIKNVASSEIYSTWPEATLRANIIAIMSFTLNRVYTEWYRNKGYDFTITTSTAYDHKWIYGRNIFDSISQVVDEIFASYVSRPNVKQPILTQYCDGKRTTCPNAMSQWGSKALGDDGYSDIDILRYYGAGYAQPSKEGLEAITLMAQQEGLILDPVYTGKAFAGLMHLIRTGKIGENETVLFLHSGGTASLFAVDPKDVK